MSYSDRNYFEKRRRRQEYAARHRKEIEEARRKAFQEEAEKRFIPVAPVVLNFSANEFWDALLGIKPEAEVLLPGGIEREKGMNAEELGKLQRDADEADVLLPNSELNQLLPGKSPGRNGIF